MTTEALTPTIDQQKAFRRVELPAVPGVATPSEEIAQMLEGVRIGIIPVEELQTKLLSAVSDQIVPEKLATMVDLLETLSDSTPTGELDDAGKDITVAAKGLQELGDLLNHEGSIAKALSEMAEKEEIISRIQTKVRAWVQEHVGEGERITKDQLATLVVHVIESEREGLERLTAEWEDLEKHPQRPWIKVISGRRSEGIPELYILGWRPPQEATLIHDHYDSEVAVHAFEGNVKEIRYATPPPEQYERIIRDENGFPTQVSTRVLPEGATVLLDAPWIHVIQCESGGKRNIAITVHAYTDLGVMRYFRYEQDQKTPRLVKTNSWEQPDYHYQRIDAPKVHLLDNLVPLVESGVQRDITADEERSLGYIVDKLWKVGMSPSELLRRAFGITDYDLPSEIAEKIARRMYQTVTMDIQRCLQSASCDAEHSRLLAIQRFVDLQHETALKKQAEFGRSMFVGAVPDYFLPAWVARYQRD